MPAFLPTYDEFVRHICRLVAGADEPIGADPKAEALRVANHLTGRPAIMAATIDEMIAEDLPLDILVEPGDFYPACTILKEVRDAALLQDSGLVRWRISTLRRHRKAIEAAGIRFEMA